MISCPLDDDDIHQVSHFERGFSDGLVISVELLASRTFNSHDQLKLNFFQLVRPVSLICENRVELLNELDLCLGTPITANEHRAWNHGKSSFPKSSNCRI